MTALNGAPLKNAATNTAANNPASSLPPEQLAQLKTQLRDIHLPDAVDWWPPAPGWWLLAFCLIGLAAWLYVMLKPRWQRRRFRQYLHRQLHAARRTYLRDKAAEPAIRSGAELLRRVCLTHYPRETVAGLTGKAWIEFLKNQAPKVQFHSSTEKLLTEGQFNNESPSKKTMKYFFKDISSWVSNFNPKIAQQARQKQSQTPSPQTTAPSDSLSRLSQTNASQTNLSQATVSQATTAKSGAQSA